MMTYYSVRHLYLAAAGLVIAIVLLLRRAFPTRSGFMAVVALLAAFWGHQLWRTLQPWHDAALLSGEVAREIARLETELQPGDVLIVDAPDLVRGGFCWAWSVPPALRPPFTHAPLDEKAAILAPDGTLAFPRRWPLTPALADRLSAHGTCWLIRTVDDRQVQRVIIAPEKLRTTAAKFEKTGRDIGSADVWPRFIRALTAP